MSFTSNVRAKVADILGSDFEVIVPQSGQKAGLVASSQGVSYLYRRPPSESWSGYVLDEDGIEIEDMPVVTTGMTAMVTARAIADNILNHHAAHVEPASRP